MSKALETVAAIDALTFRHAISGKLVDIDKSADAIVCRYPESGLFFAEICRLIAESAGRNSAMLVRKGIPVLSG
jgi:hypothetical protein